MSEYEDGSPNSPICILGEAPSHVELVERKPFVGPAGSALQRCMHAGRVARTDCYFLNVFQTSVQRDDKTGVVYDRDGQLWRPKSGFTDLGREKSANCLERARACGANVFAPLGGIAHSLLTGNTEITKWRGSIVENEFGRKTVGSLHPSAALRGKHTWIYLIAADFKRIYAESKYAEIRLDPRDLIIDPGIDEVMHAFDRCRDAGTFATDIEILGGQVSCFSLSTSPDWAISVPLINDHWQPRWPLETELRIWASYAELIGDPDITKINQNILFDLATLFHLNNIVPRGTLHDPMIAHSLMNPFLEKKLGVLCSLYTRQPYYKDDGDVKDRNGVEDWPRYWRYNALDSCIALECFDALAPQIESDGYTSIYNRTIATLAMLMEMMVRGFKVNTAELAAANIRVKAVIDALTSDMEKLFGRKIITAAPKKAAEKRALAGALNINSPKQLAKFLYDDRDIAPYTRDGAVTTDDKALAQLARTHGLKEAKLLQDYRSLSKLLGTYLEMGYDDDSRVRCSYNPRGAWTGRLSSQETVFETGGNMQNLVTEFATFLECDV